MQTKKSSKPVVLISGSFAAVLIIIATIALWPKAEKVAEAPIIKQSAYIPPPPSTASESPVKFTEVTAQSGINYRHFNGAGTDAEGNHTRFMPETMGPGVALFDYDNDNDLDVFVANSSTFDGSGDKQKMSPRLYNNQGSMKFKDVTVAAGLNLISYGMGAAVADYDADGYSDLLLTSWGGVKLLRNLGDGRFRDVSSITLPKRASQTPDWTTGAVFFDADADGDLDIYLANYVEWTPESDLFATMDGQHKSYATPNLYHGTSSRLYLQDKGKFLDATAESGMLGDEGKSLGVALWDFNADGLLDIVVANDTQPNFLYYNLGNGKFENRSLEAGIAYDENGKTRAGMGIDVADVGNDGHVCIAIGNFSREPVSIFRDEGGGFFREASQQSGVAESSYLALTFGLGFADFDLDGWQDLILANGHIEPEIENVENEIKYKQPLQLLGNTGSANFENWSNTAGEVFQKPMVSRGLAIGDLDNDGDVDIVATENNGPLHILRNDSLRSNRYLRIALRGKAPNIDSIGAQIKLMTDDGVTQHRIVKGGSSYLSHSELVQTFGLGKDASINKLSVTWPSGRSADYEISTLNKTVVIHEENDQVLAGVFSDI